MTVRFPYARQLILPEDIEAVTSALQGAMITQGENLVAFEAELASHFGVRHAIVCNSGTAALHMAYLGAGVGPDAGVLTSPLTFIATANAARMCGAPVMFADVDPDTGNVTPQSVKAALEAAEVPIRAIVPVHLGGRPCELAALREIADRAGCVLIEDACHAPDAAYPGPDGQTFEVGGCAHSEAAVFSFHAIKHIAMAEGGAVITNDDALAETARLVRSHGIVREPVNWRTPPEPNAPWYHEMHALGWNYRADEAACALGRSQLRRLEESNASRQHLAGVYAQELASVPNLKIPELPAQPEGHSWHLFAAAIDFESIDRTRGEVMTTLAAQGIGTQVHYIPLYRQPYYADDGHPALPGAEAYYARTLSLPMYFGLQDDDVREISAAVRAAIAAPA